MMQTKLLIVEDTESLSQLYQAFLIPLGVDIRTANSGKQALQSISETTPDIVLLDIMLPDMSGLEILEQLKQLDSNIQVVVLTAHGTKETVLSALRLGAADFLEKPIEADRLRITINNLLKLKQLSEIVDDYRNKFEKGQFFGLVGRSPAMQSVYKIIENAAASKASVFITGESGTGKEVCANALHQASPRKDKPFIALNCAAIPKDLIESEIFGHIKGAFTGATNGRNGAATLAHGGTLFLDEICEMELNLQSKLLRFIQTGTFNKVGSEKLEKVDIRFVCATNREPMEEVQEGRFREDLFYRLHVIPINLPALKERGDDIVLIAQHLLRRINKEENKQFSSIADNAKQTLTQYSWPGNIRQLENAIRNVVVLNEGKQIDSNMLPSEIIKSSKSHSAATIAVQPASAEQTNHHQTLTNQQSVTDIKPLWQQEKDYIEQIITLNDGNVPKAASLLEVSPSTIYRKIKQWQEKGLTVCAFG